MKRSDFFFLFVFILLLTLYLGLVYTSPTTCERQYLAGAFAIGDICR